MVKTLLGHSRRAGTRGLGLYFTGLLAVLFCAAPKRAHSQQLDSTPIVHRISAATERMELTANTSRLLTLDQKIPRAQVNNREIVELTPLSPNEIQVFAKKPGVTQINLWNEQNQVHTIDVMVLGDARELSMLIRTEFPHASIRVRPLAQSVVLSGFVDRADHVSQMIRIAEDYYPKVISQITVGGVQQIALSVKVYEVSRTKLRTLGMDWSTSSGADFFVSSVSGLIDAASASTGTAAGIGGDTIRFGIIGDDTTFFGFIEALRRNDLVKVLAEPTLVTVSGRPALFNAGGEFPIIIPQSLGTSSIEFKKYGTQVDFVPVVLGNGNIRLEVKPRVSELDPTNSVVVGGITVPGLRVREVDTGVEMKPGETLALAGLVQTRVEGQNSGIPWISDLPYFGAPFRRIREEVNEIELLIVVTPHVIQAVPCDQAPPCLPGMSSESPKDWDLYLRGHLEVPSHGPCGPGLPCGPSCGPNGCGRNGVIVPNGGLIQQEFGPEMIPPGARIEDMPAPTTTPPKPDSARTTIKSGKTASLNMGSLFKSTARSSSATSRSSTSKSKTASSGRTWWGGKTEKVSLPSKAATGSNSAPSAAARSADSRQNRAKPQGPRLIPSSPRTAANPGFIGPVGYDVTN